MHWFNENGECVCDECGPLPGSRKRLTEEELDIRADEIYEERDERNLEGR